MKAKLASSFEPLKRSLRTPVLLTIISPIQLIFAPVLSPDYLRIHQLIRHSDITLVGRLVDLQIVNGDILLAEPTAGGLTSSRRTTATSHLQTSEGMPSVVVIEQRRCCFLCLRVDDDDDFIIFRFILG